jgi:adenylate kinase
MIIFFGPAGSGKSVQGQILAARQGWRWLSTGQLLRDTHNSVLLQTMQEGKLVDSEKVNQIIGDALGRSVDIDNVILDGFPRRLEQAHWLIENQPLHGRSIGLIIVLEVPQSELEKRLELRGRPDDTMNTLEERMKAYRQEIYPLLNYFTEQDVNIIHVDGSGTVGQVHDRIMEELISCKLV